MECHPAVATISWREGCTDAIAACAPTPHAGRPSAVADVQAGVAGSELVGSGAVGVGDRGGIRSRSVGITHARTNAIAQTIIIGQPGHSQHGEGGVGAQHRAVGGRLARMESGRLGQ